MKLTLCLAAAAAALAFPGAAAARGASSGWMAPGRSSASGAALNGSFLGGSGGSGARPCAPGGPRPCRRPRHRDGDAYAFGWAGGQAALDALPAPAGFFADGGGVRVVNGRAVYDYDRSYPYDFGSRRVPRRAADVTAETGYRCSITWLAGGEGVRICRR